MKTFKNDLKFGMQNECDTHKAIERCWGIDLIKRSKFDPFDLEGDNLLIEIKSRNINHDQYDTCLVGYNKILYAKKELERNDKLNIYFFWKYKDGIFYAKYGDFEYTISEYTRGCRADRIGKDINKITCFIETKKFLKKLE